MSRVSDKVLSKWHGPEFLTISMKWNLYMETPRKIKAHVGIPNMGNLRSNQNDLYLGKAPQLSLK